MLSQICKSSFIELRAYGIKKLDLYDELVNVLPDSITAREFLHCTFV